MNEGLTLLIAIYRKIDNSTKTDNTMLYLHTDIFLMDMLYLFWDYIEVIFSKSIFLWSQLVIIQWMDSCIPKEEKIVRHVE